MDEFENDHSVNKPVDAKANDSGRTPSGNEDTSGKRPTFHSADPFLMTAAEDASYPVYTPYMRKEQDEILSHASTRQAFIAVLLCWAFGILFSEVFLKGGFGLSVPILASLFYCIAFWYFSQKEQMPPKSSFLLLIPIAALSLGYFLNDNGTVYFINTLLLLALIPLQLCLMSNTAAGPVFSAQSVYDTLVSLVARPLAYLDAPFKALVRSAGHKQKGSKSAMILLGLLIAFPIAMIFTALFSQADGAFRYFINLISEKINISFGGVVFDLFFGTITALFLSAWLITMRARNTPGKKEIRSFIQLNGTLAATVLFVISLVQIAFVVIQFEYLFAGAALPDGMNAADYARSGFFELCGVLCFSVLILLLCMLFVRKEKHQRLPFSVSVLLTVFIACNYVIIASAVYRMFAYIGAFDLSVKRVMVTWLILVFALCMAGAAIKIWKPAFRSFRYVAIVVIAMAAAVNFININALVANYNVYSYLSSLNTSRVRTIDIPYLGSLGPSAADATFQLYQNGDSNIKFESILALRTQKEQLDRKSWKNSCVSDFKAEQILSNIQ